MCLFPLHCRAPFTTRLPIPLTQGSVLSAKNAIADDRRYLTLRTSKCFATDGCFFTFCAPSPVITIRPVWSLSRPSSIGRQVRIRLSSRKLLTYALVEYTLGPAKPTAQRDTSATPASLPLTRLHRTIARDPSPCTVHHGSKLHTEVLTTPGGQHRQKRKRRRYLQDLNPRPGRAKDMLLVQLPVPSRLDQDASS